MSEKDGLRTSRFFWVEKRIRNTEGTGSLEYCGEEGSWLWRPQRLKRNGNTGF